MFATFPLPRRLAPALLAVLGALMGSQAAEGSTTLAAHVEGVGAAYGLSSRSARERLEQRPLHPARSANRGRQRGTATCGLRTPLSRANPMSRAPAAAASAHCFDRCVEVITDTAFGAD
jgi:hypothetical protein